MSKVHFEEKVKKALYESADVKRCVAKTCTENIVRAAELVAVAFKNGNKLLLCGNGGSAADCQHMATEFTSVLSKDFNRPGLAAIALTTDTSFLTAFANDFNFEGVFARKIQALGKENDIVIAISTSGNSSNILRAVEEAQKLNIRTIGLTGSGGRLKNMVDVAIIVPSTNTQYIQEAHCAIEHIICDLVENIIFRGGIQNSQTV